ncbi:MAG: hypothetical protein HY689_14530 [Chloroflexi bacterium]|nr:hypothetical protein [Chloroflexota bacterium]
MWRLRVVYWGSLALLVALLGLTVAKARTVVRSAVTVQQAHKGTVQELADHWVVLHDLKNETQEAVAYGVLVAIDGQEDWTSVTVRPYGRLTYYHHVYPEQLRSGQVTISVYDLARSRREPLDWTTYYLVRAGERAAGAPTP